MTEEREPKSEQTERLKFLLEQARKTLTGESVYASEYEALARLVEQGTTDPEVIDMVKKLPAAEITNCLHKSASLLESGDSHNTSLWLGETRDKIGEWSEQGLLTAEEIARFNAEYMDVYKKSMEVT